MTVTDGRGTAVRAPGLAAWLIGVAPSRARGDVAIAIVSDARSRALNRQFRRQDQATDVLSFPSDSRLRRTAASAGPARLDRTAASAGPATPAPVHLGDIVIAAGVARRQGRAAGHSFGAELKVLALHGLLHLLGYDHHDPADRGRMARIEGRLRAKGALRAGLIERSTRSRPRRSTSRRRT